ncbi:hypothetical protein Pcac1_g218 [Phytophthora cactorum]|nr:hypothetical protein Pcac1_g218 [Phytophthora cactorum]KAG2934373.1 hypothetical protein PC114_g949 [Phytophthora cactorum]
MTDGWVNVRPNTTERYVQASPQTPDSGVNVSPQTTDIGTDSTAQTAGINSTAISEYIRVQASGLDYLDGSYTRMARFLGSNLTPVEFQIEVNNGVRSTTTNATWIGTRTTNDFRLGSNDSTVTIITAAGRVGVGSTTP